MFLFLYELPAESQLLLPHLSHTPLCVFKAKTEIHVDFSKCLWSKYTLWTSHMKWKRGCVIQVISGGPKSRSRGGAGGVKWENRAYLISDFKPFQQGDKLLLDVWLLRREKMENNMRRSEDGCWGRRSLAQDRMTGAGCNGNFRAPFHAWWLKTTAVNGYSTRTYFCLSHKVKVLSMQIFLHRLGCDCILCY